MLVYVDTREKYPWDLSFYSIDVSKKKLDTGDYTIAGLEDKVCFERKRSCGEIAINLGFKWKQFEAELNRMITYKYRYIICEFNIIDISTFPKNSGIPEKDWKYLKMNGPFINKRLFEETSKRGIEVLFFNSCEEAQEAVVELMIGISNQYAK